MTNKQASHSKMNSYFHHILFRTFLLRNPWDYWYILTTRKNKKYNKYSDSKHNHIINYNRALIVFVGSGRYNIQVIINRHRKQNVWQLIRKLMVSLLIGSIVHRVFSFAFPTGSTFLGSSTNPSTRITRYTASPSSGFHSRTLPARPLDHFILTPRALWLINVAVPISMQTAILKLLSRP